MYVRGNETYVSAAETIDERCLDQGTVFAIIPAAASLEIARNHRVSWNTVCQARSKTSDSRNKAGCLSIEGVATRAGHVEGAVRPPQVGLQKTVSGAIQERSIQDRTVPPLQLKGRMRRALALKAGALTGCPT